MKTKGALGLVAVLALAAACAPAEGPPQITVDRTACYACGMLVSEPRYAAAYRVPGGEARTFDDVGCMLEALAGEAEADSATVWVQASVAGGWLDARTAWYVRAPGLTTPMGSGIHAVPGQEAARLLAERTAEAETLDFAALLARGGTLPGRHVTEHAVEGER